MAKKIHLQFSRHTHAANTCSIHIHKHKYIYINCISINKLGCIFFGLPIFRWYRYSTSHLVLRISSCCPFSASTFSRPSSSFSSSSSSSLFSFSLFQGQPIQMKVRVQTLDDEEELQGIISLQWLALSHWTIPKRFDVIGVWSSPSFHCCCCYHHFLLLTAAASPGCSCWGQFLHVGHGFRVICLFCLEH